MRRFSILSLMAFVLVSAIGLAALRNANEHWAGAMLAIVFVVGALRGRRIIRLGIGGLGNSGRTPFRSSPSLKVTKWLCRLPLSVEGQTPAINRVDNGLFDFVRTNCRFSHGFGGK